MIGSFIVLCIAGAMLASLWSNIGPNHLTFPLCVSLISFGFPVFIGANLARSIPKNAFRISDSTVRLFNALGVKAFDRTLTAVRWNALVRGMRKPVTSPADLSGLSFDLRSATAGHFWVLMLHAAVALATLFTGNLQAIFWVLIPSLPLHIYPIILQLNNLHRIHDLTDRRKLDTT